MNWSWAGFLCRTIVFAGLLLPFGGCNSSSSDIEDAIDDIEDVVDPDRRPIDVSRLGVNAFVNDARFGSMSSQFREVRDTLRLGRVRALFNWDDGVQPSPGVEPNFAFYDQIVDAIPSGMEVFVVLAGLPGWMSDSSNWIDGNPRTTFVEQWVRKVAQRYAGRGRVIGFQIWNEPNMAANPDNGVLGVAESPENYVEMLARAFSVMRDVAPGKLVISAATTAINQNFPGTLNYNRAMRDAGARDFLDIYAVHYYGEQFENVVRPDGVRDYLNGLGARIWLTESGEQGVNNQLRYGETVWPFLLEQIPSIERIYIYQFTEATPAESTYGLRNLTAGSALSDLYIFLRDRP